MIIYKDFATGRKRRTNGRFVRWEKGGPLNELYAIIELPRSVLMIPRYCMTVESRLELPDVPPFPMDAAQ